MAILRNTLRALTLFLAVAAAAPSWADEPPVLEWSLSDGGKTKLGARPEHGLFFQEYWENGDAKYLVYNSSAEKRALKSILWVPRAGKIHVIDHFTKNPWEIGPGEVKSFDARRMQGVEGFLGVYFDDGKLAAILQPPQTLPREAESGVALTGDLNRGGTEWGLWVEYRTVEARPGEIEARLWLLARSGYLRLLKKPEGEKPVALPELELAGVRSPSLGVTENDAAWTIDGNRPQTEGVWHEVVVRLKATTDKPTLAFWRFDRCADASCEKPVSSHLRAVALLP